jgi:hypothetical protein
MNRLSAEHIQEFLSSGRATLLPLEVSTKFLTYIESVPRLGPLGTTVDWSLVPNHQSINWFAVSDAQFVAWARNMAIGRNSKVGAWLTPHEPAIVFDFAFGLQNLDTIIWKSPGIKYVFGVDEKNGSQLTPVFADFLEVASGELVRGTS